MLLPPDPVLLPPDPVLLPPDPVLLLPDVPLLPPGPVLLPYLFRYCLPSGGAPGPVLLPYLCRYCRLALCYCHQVERLQLPLCGKSRPHFFRGVATVRR